MRITLLSNGHGEDIVGSLLATNLRQLEPTLSLQAFPTVGLGQAYERAGVPLIGPRRELPSGGLMLHSLGAFRSDLRAGFVTMTRRQLRELPRLQTDVLVVVGDLYALLLGHLIRTTCRFYVQTLVSSYHSGRPAPSDPPTPSDSSPTYRTNRRMNRPNRYFMEHFSLPERMLLRRNTHTYVRDEPTAAFLARSGLAVSALGNPMLDALRPSVSLELPLTAPIVALLPGTRGYKETALKTMLETLEALPEATGLIAWTDAEPPPIGDWQSVADGIWQRGERTWLVYDRFSDVLAAADLVLSTAGTASEQAAALGKPVVAFPVPPLYTEAFLANQQRLLGAALTRCRADPQGLAAALRTLWQDRESYRAAAAVGRARMGERGGAAATAADILTRASPRFH